MLPDIRHHRPGTLGDCTDTLNRASEKRGKVLSNPNGLLGTANAFYMSVLHDQPLSQEFGKEGKATLTSLAYQIHNMEMVPRYRDGIYWQGVQTYLTKLAGKK